jgi:TatD DNase family protein
VSERERPQRERAPSEREGARGASRREGAPPPPEPLPAEVLDSHCHLDAMGLSTAEEVAAAVAAAQAVGVRRVVTVGDTLTSSRWCAGVAATHPDVYAAVAVHPNEVAGIDEATYADLADLAAQPQVRAVGETGLDLYWGRVPAAAQEEAFRRHIALAKQAGKALVIHDRDAHDSVLRVLSEEDAPEWTVLHCFSGDAEMAKTCVDRGYVLSFAGTVTFRNAAALREAAAVVPLDQVLVETDAPFLAPTPYRGRPNAPYLVPLTVRALADIKRVDLADLCAAIGRNGERVFGPW